MNARRMVIILAAAGALGGCATFGGTAVPGRGNCADGVALEDIPLPVPEAGWSAPETLASGFLRIHYRWTGNVVYAIGVLYVSADQVTVPFIVELPGVPDDWKDDPTQSQAKEGIPSQWFDFFTKLRTIRNVKPGGFVCRGRSDCARTPDSPPPDIVGSASTGGSGTYAMAESSPSQLYAEALRTRPSATDALGAAAAQHETSVDRGQVVNKVVSGTCRGIRAFLE